MVGLFSAVAFHCHAVSLSSCVSWKILWSWSSITNNRTGIWFNKNTVSSNQSCIGWTWITPSACPCFLHWLTEFFYLEKKIKENNSKQIYSILTLQFYKECVARWIREMKRMNSTFPYVHFLWVSGLPHYPRGNWASPFEDCSQTAIQGVSEKGFWIYFTEG